MRVGDRELSLSNLHKVLYPSAITGIATTKGEVIEYYSRIAPVMLEQARKP